MSGRALGLVALVTLLASGARAQAPTAADRMREARAAEAAAHPREAVAHYRELIEGDPTSRLAGRARRRLEWLEARAEGDYEPLARVLAFQGLTPAQRATAARVEGFEAEVRGFPPGLVRREAWSLLAESWLDAGAPSRAEAAYEALLREPDLAEDERVVARTGIARARARREGPAAGAESLERAGLGGSETHRQLEREARRGPARILAWSILALFVVLALAVGRRGMASRRVLARAFAPWRLLLGAHVALVPWWLAWRYDQEAFDTFGGVALGSAAILALTSLAGVAASERGAGRGERAGLAASAALAYGALGWLALDRAGQLLSFLA